MTETKNGTRIGLLWGVVAGIVYMILLYLRYRFFGSTASMLSIFSSVAYVIFLALLVVAAYYRRQQLGGYATIKEIFSSVFIVILIAEVCFTLFNYIYLTYIDPGYLERFGHQTLEMMREQKVSEQRLKEFADIMKDQKQTSFGTLMIGLAQSIVMDSVFGLIIAFILKRKKQEEYIING